MMRILTNCQRSDILKTHSAHSYDMIHTSLRLQINTIRLNTLQLSVIPCDWTMQRKDAMQFNEVHYLLIK